VVVQQKPRVALLAAPKTTPSVLFGLYDVLLSAGAVYPDMTVGEPGDALLDVMIVSASAEPFRCFGNVLIEPHAALSEVERVNVAVVCDMYTPIDTPPRGQYLQEIAWLKSMHAAGALISSVCSGSLVLAEAGLLDGQPCATHWAYVDYSAYVIPPFVCARTRFSILKVSRAVSLPLEVLRPGRTSHCTSSPGCVGATRRCAQPKFIYWQDTRTGSCLLQLLAGASRRAMRRSPVVRPGLPIITCRPIRLAQ
jgi:putative intracellular protease/amidase